MDTITKQLAQIRCIPMVKQGREDQAEALAKALRASDLRTANISQQMNGGLALLRRLAQEEDLLIGAGNVQTLEEAKAAVKAGAAFIFSPLFNEQMVEFCQQEGTPIYPVTTQASVARAWNLKTLGCYPVEELGGLPFINTLGEQEGLTFIVAGHINEEMTATYLENPHVLAMTGSWMLKETDWEATTAALKRAKRFALPSA
ncbi:hypothetical protein [uncultured Sphaerochaeta sp.]|uniref:hypothetical protein n=1 Tax=uncultured Sphaerochaeta sp. TaxID=886478 RepID=UPI0029CA8470|nr:hypothetical protein [uncultured Sphaerochaeta sp.]